MKISVVLLTFNSAASLPRTLRAAKLLSDDIHAVDSHSTDATLSVLAEFGVTVIQRPFRNYSDQRNWAIDNLKLRHGWQLHLDADEEMEPALVAAIGALGESPDADGYIVGRKIVFLGRTLRYGGIAKTWHYRLFRTGFGRCEDRLYDQHFVGSGRVGTIDAFMLDHQEDRLSEWTARHNRWSDLEAAEAESDTPASGATITPRSDGNAIEKARARKAFYYRAPLFWRVFGYFFVRYVVQLGFLDGREGLIYHVLQALWFRFLVDAKIYETRVRGPRQAPDSEKRST